MVLDSRVHQEQLASQALKVKLEALDLLDHKDLLDGPDHKVHKDSQETLDGLVLRVQQEVQDLLAHKVLLVVPVGLVH